MTGLTLYALTGAALVGIGFYGLLAARHLLRRVIGFNLIGSGLFVFFGAAGARGAVTDPVPQALIITGIVVALSASALAVGLIAALARATGRATLPGEDGGEAGGEAWARVGRMTAFLVLLAGPLAGALASVALPGRAARGAAAAAIAATLAAALVLAGRVLAQGVLRVEPGGWAPPLGIALEADGLSAVLLAMTALVMTGAGLAARHELAPGAAGRRAAFGFWPLMLLLWAALNAVFLSRDLFNLYVGLELVSLAAIGLVAIDGRAAAFAAAFRYMTFALAGSLLYLAGVILIYAAHGTLDMALLATRIPAAPDGLALALMTGGLMAKTALFPFHVWLPPAHGSAPAPASAILSALVPKASFVILLRLWLETMPDRATEGALVVMAALGAAAVIWGSLRAIDAGAAQADRGLFDGRADRLSVPRLSARWRGGAGRGLGGGRAGRGRAADREPRARQIGDVSRRRAVDAPRRERPARRSARPRHRDADERRRLRAGGDHAGRAAALGRVHGEIPADERGFRVRALDHGAGPGGRGRAGGGLSLPADGRGVRAGGRIATRAAARACPCPRARSSSCR